MVTGGWLGTRLRLLGGQGEPRPGFPLFADVWGADCGIGRFTAAVYTRCGVRPWLAVVVVTPARLAWGVVLWILVGFGVWKAVELL